jgi:hypothetical protein
MVKISNKPITGQCMQRISNTGFSTRIRTINTIVLTNAILHIQFAMCREYSKVFLPPEDDNAQIWQFMNFPEFVRVSDQASLFFLRQ